MGATGTRLLGDVRIVGSRFVKYYMCQVGTASRAATSAGPEPGAGNFVTNLPGSASRPMVPRPWRSTATAAPVTNPLQRVLWRQHEAVTRNRPRTADELTNPTIHRFVVKNYI